MYLVTGKQKDLPAGLFSEVANYRHKVFVERLGWQLQTFDNMEQDEFDSTDTVYIITRDEEGNISGCGRLLPTTRPYLIGKVFPEVFNGMPPPSAPDVWELSRFAAVDFNSKSGNSNGQFSSPITVMFLKEIITYAASLGAKRIVTITSLAGERLLKCAGFKAHRTGPPMIVDGHPVCACWIETEA